MVDKTRRSLLGATAAAAASGLVGACTSAGVSDAPKTEEEKRVLIIGSGFGGGVSALRLAQAGISSTVLERGVWWLSGPNAETFPHAGAWDKRLFWYTTFNPLDVHVSLNTLFQTLGLPIEAERNLERYAGVLEPVYSRTMTIICPAGVGGGSLVYQGMSLQPTEELFYRCFPKEIDYQEMDEVYYPRVAEMLGLATAPDELIESPNYLASRVFARNCQRAGYNVEKVPMPIDWSFALRELNGEMKPSYTNGDCAMGVNNGGKHSVDVTYIKQALDTGLVELKTLHNVTDVARAPDGRWQVFVDVTDESGKLLEQKVITTKALIMAAGSVNTTKLMVRAKALGNIPDLPDAVGEGWGSNADRILMWNNREEEFGAEQGGPVVYWSRDWEQTDTANTVIQASLPPVGLKTATMLVGYGVSDARGTWTYDPRSGDVDLDWAKEADVVVHTKIRERVDNIVGDQGSVIDTNAIVPSTWHPLGGVCMEAVCDLDGRVHNHPGLYVLDGALIPGSTAACNPSLTIAAIAERAIDNIIANDIGTLI